MKANTNVNFAAQSVPKDSAKIIKFQRFSSFSKLYNVVEILFKYLQKIRPDINVSNKTLNFLIRSSQQHCFQREISHL